VKDLTWEPPGPGIWFASAEHMPTPGCTLLVELLPGAARGWAMGNDEYGLLPNTAAFGSSNRWFYYSPGMPGPIDVDVLDQRAAASLAERRWRADLQRWHDEVRPAVMAESRALVAAPLGSLDDAELGVHLRRAIDHFVEWSPMHFAATAAGTGGCGALLHATRGWGLDPREMILALAGSAPASSSGERLLDRIAAGLREAGVDDVPSLAAVHRVGGDTAAALDELLVDYGWRAFNVDLLEPTLAERPESVLASIRAALVGWAPRGRPDGSALSGLRARVPEGERAEFDELAADASAAYGHNDDNTGVLFSLPLGLVRRALLEVGRRLAEREAVLDPDDAFEATRAELDALLEGGGPPAEELSRRSAFRRAMARVVPPPMLGTPVDPPVVDPGPYTRRLEEVFDAFRSAAWTREVHEGRAAATVGTEVVRGRAVVVVDAADAIARIEPGDVLVARTTTASFNVIFPLAAAVAVQEGSLMSHPAVLARELGLTAVIGVPDLLSRVADGDTVEIDPVAGTIRVLMPGRLLRRSPRRG
jgi:phosphohistidine swiveling domain-containing protein